MPAAPPRHYDPEANGDVGKRWQDLWSAGQGVGAVKSIEPTAVVVDRLAQEFDAARARLARWSTQGGGR